MREILFVSLTIALTLLSFAVVLNGMNAPYEPSTFDALMQLVLAPALVVAWLRSAQFAVTRALHSELFIVWLAAAMWSVMCVTYLLSSLSQ
jgi:hypothetical protein